MCSETMLLLECEAENNQLWEAAVKYLLCKDKITGARSVRLADGQVVTEAEHPTEYKRLRRLALQARNRAAIAAAYESCGMRCGRDSAGRSMWW